MEGGGEPEGQQENDVASQPPIRLRDHFWRPRIARGWCAATLLWWIGFVQAQETGWLLNFFRTALAGYLTVLFFPMTVIMALGVPFVWAKLDRGDWAIPPGPLPLDQHFPSRSVEGMQESASDPLDSRSGILH